MTVRNYLPRLVLAALCAALLAGLAPAAGRRHGPAPTLADVKYGPHERNVLDFWKVESDKPTPVLIYFHGGGYVSGNKSLRAFQAWCLRKGISAVSANYRYARPEGVTILDCLADGARVVQFIRSKAEQWNIDPERIALTGTSAGGQMAVWIALHDDLADPKSKDPIKRLSTRVACVVGYGAPTSMDPAVILKHVGGPPYIHPVIPQVFDVESVEDLRKGDLRKLVAESSPIEHASKDDPPLYLVYGDRPPAGPYPPDTPHGITIHSAKFGLMLKDKLDPLGVECTLSYPGSRPKEGEADFLLRHFKMAEAPTTAPAEVKSE